MRLFKRKKVVKTANLSKFMIIAVITKLLEERYEFDDVADFLEDIGAKSAELLYIDGLTYFKSSRNVFEFAKNTKKGFEIYFDTKVMSAKLLLNTEANTATISITLVNPLCENFIAPNPSIRPGLYVVGILKTIANIKRKEFKAYEVLVKERKCVTLGDEFDEYVITFYLSEEGVKEMLKVVEPNKWIKI